MNEADNNLSKTWMVLVTCTSFRAFGAKIENTKHRVVLVTFSGDCVSSCFFDVHPSPHSMIALIYGCWLAKCLKVVLATCTHTSPQKQMKRLSPTL